MKKILIRNALVVATQDDTLGEIGGGDVLIEGPVVRAVGKNLPAEGAAIIDASDRVVLPGFVNTHHHLYQVLTRNLPAVQDAKLFDWLRYLYDVWKHIRPEDVLAAARAGLGELLLTGCTTVADHHYLVCPGECADPFSAEAQAAEEIGCRLHLSRGSMSLGQSQGGLPPDSVIQDEESILCDSERVVKALHDPTPLSRRRVALAPCSPFSVTPTIMKRVAELARKLGVRLHTHLAETIDEERFCLERFGKRPLSYMEEVGWVGPDVWMAHCVYLDDGEIRRMAETGTGVAHCPVSNLRLGSGIAPVPKMLAAGVPVGLAVDGSASNDSSNMLRELRTALLVHRVGTGVAAMPARAVLRMATRGGARVLGRDDLGRIAPGQAADIAIFDVSGMEFAGAHSDPLAALLFCGVDDRAETVLVHGEVVVRERRLVRLDERSIAREARAASCALLERAGV